MNDENEIILEAPVPVQFNFITVPLTSENITEMYSHPVVVLPSLNYKAFYLINSWSLEVQSQGGSFVGGGAVVLQYGNAPHGDGILAVNGIPSAVVTNPIRNYQENNINAQSGFLGGSAPVRSTEIANLPICISNTAFPFSLGNLRNHANLFISYFIVPMLLPILEGA